MNKKEVMDFFDGLAATWDDHMVKESHKIQRILDAAEIKEGCIVLDVACGTGVLIPDYLERGIEKVVGVDISSQMIEIAKKKFENYENVEFCCGDIEEIQFENTFDSVVVYNAFPHFCNPKGLIEKLAENLKNGGRLTIAHGMGIEQLNKHHSGRAKKVSNGLISVEEMQELFTPYFEVDVKVSTEEIYIVSGSKKYNF